MQLFTPRRPKSPWSRINREKVARLSAQGLMAPAGMRMVEAARGFFERFPDSSKKAILWWIKTAKRPETRAGRIAETVSAAAQNRMANHFAGRDAGPA